MKITFLSHSITYDNEAGRASGWNDVKLSPEGIKRVKDWADQFDLSSIDMVYASDLQRAYKTASLAFPGLTSQKLLMDWRLRECDYGDLTLQPKSSVVDPQRTKYIHEPFPNRESYDQAMTRMKSFIEDLKTKPYGHVVIIGSRATHYGLDVHINGKTIEDCLSHKFVWQPGWAYTLKP